MDERRPREVAAEALEAQAVTTERDLGELRSSPGPLLDEALWRVIAAENHLIAPGAMPGGSSVFAIGRRA